MRRLSPPPTLLLPIVLLTSGMATIGADWGPVHSMSMGATPSQDSLSPACKVTRTADRLRQNCRPDRRCPAAPINHFQSREWKFHQRAPRTSSATTECQTVRCARRLTLHLLMVLCLGMSSAVVCADLHGREQSASVASSLQRIPLTVYNV